jgi:hypothetical protein
MAKNKRIRPTPPDESYNLGPFSMTRYGRYVQFQNNMSDSQMDVFQKRLADLHEHVVAEINKVVAEIVSVATSYDPVELLTRGFHRIIQENLDNKEPESSKAEGALRLVDYVQCIIVSNPPTLPYQKLTDDAFARLDDLVQSLFEKLQTQFVLTEYAHGKTSGLVEDADRDSFIVHAQLHWCYVRGKRYQVHEIPLLKLLLLPHSDLFLRNLGIPADRIIDNLDRILKSLTFGPFQSVSAMNEFQAKSLAEIDRRVRCDPSFERLMPPEQMKAVCDDNRWAAWAEQCLNNLFGDGLFAVDKYCDLPDTLLRELALAPGEDKAFSAAGEYAGWPFRNWPIFSHPFLSHKGNYYCFDLHSLFDNIYRNLYRSLIRLAADQSHTRQEWNNVQKVVTEALPLDLLLKLMPDATVYRGVYYRHAVGETSAKQWCEVDGIVVYLDSIFVVEVKAGSLTPTPPMQNAEEYLNSIGELVEKPAKQGCRFLSFLESLEQCDIFDEKHKKIASLKKDAFFQKVILAVTVDGFTQVSANVQELADVGLNLGDHPIWSISIDDLMVYSESFDNPLLFLHFVRMRMEAFKRHDMTALDELDHLGLYLEFNNYSSVVDDFSPKTNIMWNGYTDRIDELFYKKLGDPAQSTVLYQHMPTLLFEIVQLLGQSSAEDRSVAARKLLDAEERIRRQTEEGISNWMAGKPGLAGKGLLHMIGSCRFSILCNWNDLPSEERKKEAEWRTKAIMVKHSEQDRCLICLTYDRQHKLSNVSPRLFRSLDILPEEHTSLLGFAEQEGTRRVSKHVAEHGTIGRNEQCPCGSGLKYKKCCLRKKPTLVST